MHARKPLPNWLANLPLLIAALCASSLSGEESGAARPRTPNSAPVRDREHVFQQYPKSWTGLRTENVVMQQRDYSCGAASLATLIRYHWEDQVTETQLIVEVVKMLTPEEMKERIENGLSLTDLRRLAVKLGYLSTIGRLEFDKLSESKVPLIVGIVVNGFDHFVVFRGTDGDFVYLADPARGNIRTPVAEFKQQWQKNAVLVVVKPGVKPDRISVLSVRPEETLLGETNRQYIRRRVTSDIAPR